ncbi:MAG: polysaccharide deacetylase family protein [Thermomicrobiales bacterium]
MRTPSTAPRSQRRTPRRNSPFQSVLEIVWLVLAMVASIFSSKNNQAAARPAQNVARGLSYQRSQTVRGARPMARPTARPGRGYAVWAIVLVALLLSATFGVALAKRDGNKPPASPTAELAAAGLPVAGTATAAPRATAPKGGVPPQATKPPAVAPTATVAPKAPAAAPGGPPPLPPNELGYIPVLMYHTFLPNAPGDVYNRTPDEFRQDLEYLYEHGYYLTPMHDLLTGNIDIPAGKSPVVLTFDDSPESQYRLLINPDGSTTIDPNCAVGIIEDIYHRHPDFGRAGAFYVLPILPFGDQADENHQRQFIQQKLEWLVANGYEIGNHTLHHANLGQMNNTQIMQEIAGGDDGIHKYLPNYNIETMALPYGVYPPHGDTTLLKGFTYQGRMYKHQLALMVGADPAPSPFDKRRDLMWTPRIRGSSDQLGKWFGNFLDKEQGVRYVSDGDPNKVMIPADLPAALRDKFNQAAVGNRQLVRP